MKKWIEIILGVLLLLLLIFRGAELWIGSKIKKMAATELHDVSDGLYKLDIGRLSLNLFDLSVKIKNVSILTDSIRLEHITTQIDTMRTDSLKRYRPCLKLYIAELHLKGIWYKRHAKSPTDPAFAAGPAANNDIDIDTTIKRSFDKLSVNRIRMRGVDAAYSLRKDNDTISYYIKRTTVEADEFDINSDPAQNPLHCHDIRLNMRKFEHIYERRSMTMFVDTLKVSTRDKSLSANALRIEPNYPKEEFARSNPKHIDWSFYKLRALDFTGVDFTALVYDNQLSVDSIGIGRLDAGSYKDRNVYRVEWEKYMFYESLHRLPLKLRVGSLSVAEGTAFYEELPQGGTASAVIQFNDLSAHASGLSNLPDNPAKYIVVNAAGRVMDAGQLKVEFLAPARPTDTHFEITGSLGPMEMAVMNPLVEPLGKVRIDNGRIDSIDFHVTGNTYRSQVEMTLLYDSLNIDILKEDKLGHEHKRVFLSALANNMVLRSSNPDNRGKRHKGTGAAERDMYRSQYNYMWKSLYPGIKTSVGIPESLGK